MIISFLIAKEVLLASSQAWKPPESLVHFLFIIGAFLFAGVALSIFTFYEDYYWNDKDYRKSLKEGKRPSAKA